MKLPLWWPSIGLGLALSLLIPLATMLIALPIRKGRRLYQWIMLCACMGAILSLTVIRGMQSSDTPRGINLIPFWSYSQFSQADYRWQICMNIFLFIPFGMLFPWAASRTFIRTLLAGIVFSVLIEFTQYLFNLGFCETDDVIHNTIGTVIGYCYWRALDRTVDHLKTMWTKNRSSERTGETR